MCVCVCVCACVCVRSLRHNPLWKDINPVSLVFHTIYRYLDTVISN